MEKETKNIFIHAISQRCGHNYLARLIQSQTDFQVFIHKNHEVILPETLAKEMEKLKTGSGFIRNKKAKIKELELAANAYINQKKNTIFKTSMLTSKFEIDLFPDVKHIILIRNPQDLFVSYEKSIYNFRIKTLKNSIKKLFRPFYSYYVLRTWTKHINKSIKAYQASECNILVVKYEGLLEKDGQQKVFDFINHKTNLTEKIKISNENSSFAKDSERWKLHSKEIGKTTERFNTAPVWLKWIIRCSLSKTVINLNYDQ